MIARTIVSPIFEGEFGVIPVKSHVKKAMGKDNNGDRTHNDLVEIVRAEASTLRTFLSISTKRHGQVKAQAKVGLSKM
ncbi:MAG: hypothetical protein Ct9H300mP27_06840 [Chloroflexota bacterium]|nr:MAG: hypothetical protein Ct9H300mP27_06840 [Chloroflexota bacterium]